LKRYNYLSKCSKTVYTLFALFSYCDAFVGYYAVVISGIVLKAGNSIMLSECVYLGRQEGSGFIYKDYLKTDGLVVRTMT